jgi:transposase
MFSITTARYFLFNQATDMRKSFDGLSAIVHSQMKQNPLSGDVYVFLNRSRNRIKLLRWETDGFVLFYKRLEQGTFPIPKGEDLSGFDYTKLVLMINGISVEKARKSKRFYPQNSVVNSL